MRNGPQQKRMRGRNRGGGGGKNPNPLSRSYESNGPDVKVRGTAAHIAERYMQLARDAQSSGDPILAEAYLQHAEHYFRIIAAAQPAFGGQPTHGPSHEEESEGEEDMDFDGPMPSLPQPANPTDPEARSHQPYRERPFNERREGSDRGYQDRDRQGGDRQRGERFQGDRSHPRGEGDESGRFPRRNPDRRFQDRAYQDRANGERVFSPPPAPLDQPQPHIEEATLSTLPSFITGGNPEADDKSGEQRFPLRNRRRRGPDSNETEAVATPDAGTESAD